MAKKKKSTVNLSLTHEELGTIISILHEKEESIRYDLKNSDYSLSIKSKLLDSLDDIDKKSYISNGIKWILFRMTGVQVDKIKDDDNLEDDLNMGSLQIRSLAIPFTNLARHFNQMAVITPIECEDSDTVNDCIDLINKKS